MLTADGDAFKCQGGANDAVQMSAMRLTAQVCGVRLYAAWQQQHHANGPGCSSAAPAQQPFACVVATTQCDPLPQQRGQIVYCIIDARSAKHVCCVCQLCTHAPETTPGPLGCWAQGTCLAYKAASALFA